MQRATLIVLLAGFVFGASNDSDNNLQEKVKTMNAVLKIYDEKLETVVPFKAIRSSIEGLDLMSIKYNGNCTTLIDQAGDSGHQAIDNYYRGTDFLVRWCASAKRVLGFVLTRHNKITEDQVQKAVGTTINKGFKAFNESLTTLNTVVNQLTNMQNKLEPIPVKLNLELKQLQAIHEQDIANKRKTEEWVTRGLAAVSSLVSYVLTLSLGPAGTAIGLASQLILKGIPSQVIEGRIIPDANQKMKIVEVYYTCLIDTAMSANTNVTKVADEFEHSFVDKLRPWAENEDNSDSNSNGNQDSGNSTLVLEEVKQMMTTLDQFLQRYTTSDGSRLSREINHLNQLL
ncbi:hypothetical protein WDU94_009430 [Cyamophila willieti]